MPLIMYTDIVRTGFLELPDVPLRVYDHQVYIAEFLGVLAYSLQDGETKRDIRHENAVHHIYMYPLRLTLVKHLYITAQMGKIC
jgi:hypothetical protein